MHWYQARNSWRKQPKVRAGAHSSNDGGSIQVARNEAHEERLWKSSLPSPSNMKRMDRRRGSPPKRN